MTPWWGNGAMSTKLEGNDRPTYVLSYPRSIRMVRMGLIALLTVAALVHWVLAWINFVRPVGQAIGLSVDVIDAVAAQPLRPLFSAHLSLLLVVWALSFVYAFLPDLSLADGGLAVRTMLGWQVIPWSTITTVRATSLGNSDRQILLLQGHWTRSVSARLTSMCMGAGFAPGLLFTSDLTEFSPLLERMYREIQKASPDTLIDDEFFALPAKMILEPTPTLADLVDQARGEGWPLYLSAQAMMAVVGGLVLAQLLMLVLVGASWWKPLMVIGLSALEWIIGALYIYALTEIFPAQIEFREAGLLYPLPQIPRALMAIPMTMLIAAGVPFLGAMLGLAGILWSVLLTILLVQQVYHLKSILPAAIGGAIQVLYLFLVLAIVFSG